MKFRVSGGIKTLMTFMLVMISGLFVFAGLHSIYKIELQESILKLENTQRVIHDTIHDVWLDNMLGYLYFHLNSEHVYDYLRTLVAGKTPSKQITKAFIEQKNEILIESSSRHVDFYTKELQVLDNGDQHLAMAIMKEYPERMNKLLKGEYEFFPPIEHGHRDTLIYAGVPFFDEQSKVYAVSLVSVDLLLLVEHILEHSYRGKSGESYKIDDHGHLLTKSRFVSNFRGHFLDTLIVQKARTEQGSGYIDEPYLDYRGVPVIGVWSWDDELGIGHISEMDYEEALDNYIRSRNIIITIFIASLLFFAIFYFVMQRIAANAFKRLKGSEDLLRNIMESTGDGIVAISEKGLIKTFNKAAEELFGYDRSEVLGKNVSMLMPEPHKSKHDQYLKRYLDTGVSKIMGSKQEVMGVTKEGRLFTMALRVSETFHGKKRIFIALIDDISERKKYEHALIAAKDVAESAAQAKSEFLANMSHEIRTPMNAIIGMTHLALDEQLDPKVKEYIKKSNRAAMSLLVVINDILDFSKVEAGKMELAPVHFNIKDVITPVLDIIKDSAKKKGIKTRVVIEKGMHTAYHADSMRLEQVLLNILNNAIKFSKDEGEVTIRVGMKEEEASHATLQFSVEDQGIGISEQNQKNLFQPFVQAESSTTRKFGGTGLGLAISRKIVNLMGGEIWVESKEGEGSTFYFTMRLEKSLSEIVEQEDADKENTLANATKILQDKTILLVEDNEFNQVVAQDLLSKKGVKVYIANNGLEALHMLRERAYDIVLMDCQMPIMDGYEATKNIRQDKTYENLPILAMTANIMQEDIQKAKKAGMNDHIGKPIDPENMFSVIEKWILKKEGTKEG